MRKLIFTIFTMITATSFAANENCPQMVFSGALAQTAPAVSESDPESVIQGWVYKTFSLPDTIKKVLACPEVASLNEMDDFTVPPIEYVFAGGRRIVINYSTQKKILQQRLMAANKHSLPSTNASEKIDPNGNDVWTNTDPAWYGILVVKAGALDKYVGNDKNNTISLKYLENNISEFYPESNASMGAMCTSQSALANDNDIVNLASHKTVSVGDKDSNDYYIAGDVNLQWITWAEVAADVAITVATVGGGTVVLGATKGVRATRTAKNLVKGVKELRQLEKIKNYEKIIQESRKAENIIKDLNKITDTEKSFDNAADFDKLMNAVNIDKNMVNSVNDIKSINGNIVKLENKIKNAQKFADTSKDIQNLENLKKVKADKIAELDKNMKNMSKAKADDFKLLTDQQKELEKLDDVKKYNNANKQLEEVLKLRRDLKAWRVPQRGNVISRPIRASKGILQTMRAMARANKVISRGNKVARGMMSSRVAKISDWLFHNTMRNIGAVAKMERDAGLVYSAVKFAGDMYDWSETSTGDFTSNIQFKPLGLLSADDLEGQENVVNHGMWLMWAGDSVNPTDDDAAYLQAMDFAEKFTEDVQNTNDEMADKGRSESSLCNIDVYVVRPIIKNPGSDNQELFYLIMNDNPWQIR